MRERIFVTACRLVDKAIEDAGEPVSAEERNRRVLAAEHNLRQGTPADKVDTRSRLSVISVASLMNKAPSTDPVS